MKSYFTFLALSSLLLLTTKINARPDPAEYWNKFVSNEPIPDFIKDLLDVNSKERHIIQKGLLPLYRNSEKENSIPSIPSFPNSEEGKPNPSEYWNRVMKGEPIPDFVKDLLDVNSKERHIIQKGLLPLYRNSEKENSIPSFPNSEEGKPNPSEYWNRVMKGEPIPDFIKDLLDANSKERHIIQKGLFPLYRNSEKGNSIPSYPKSEEGKPNPSE